MASSPGKRTRLERVDGDTPLGSILSSFGPDVDMVIAEGFKANSVPKVLVLSNGGHPPEVQNVIAIVSDTAETQSVPTYSFQGLDGLATYLREQLLEPGRRTELVSLTVDGADVPLSRFAASVLIGIVHGYIGSLKGIPDNPSEIQITIQVRERARGGTCGHEACL